MDHAHAINAAFIRGLLKLTTSDVRTRCPEVKISAAWVYGYGRGQWEFHGPDEFYWSGRAYNAYDARAKGWQAYLRSVGKAEE